MDTDHPDIVIQCAAQRLASRAPVAAAKETSALSMGYRSFYVSDEAYSRFRAAIHWSSRHPAAAGQVPDNMSAACEAWMDATADDLEARFHHGVPFPVPPVKKRRKRPAGA